MSNRNRPWTADDDQRLLDLRAAGRSFISIGLVLRRSAAAVEGRFSVLGKRKRQMAGIRQELKPMATFDPAEPAILYDRLTDKMETWTGEDALDYRQNAVSKPDGTVAWRRFLFDGWGNVLGG